MTVCVMTKGRERMSMVMQEERRILTQQEHVESVSYTFFENKLFFQRNKIMAYLVLLISVLGTPLLAVQEGMQTGIVAAMICIVLNVIFFSAVKMKIGIRQIPYIIAVLASLLMIYVNFEGVPSITIRIFSHMFPISMLIFSLSITHASN